MSSGVEPQPAIGIVLVESEACHLCADAASAIDAMMSEHHLQVRRVDLSSEEGKAIMREHRATMPPIVLVDGQLLGWGRLSRGKLRHRLAELDAGAAR